MDNYKMIHQTTSPYLGSHTIDKKTAWINAAKGFAILCVVIGHSDLNSPIINIIFWFSMPAFFIIAGYLFRPKENYLQVRLYRLLIPYLCFSIIIYAINIVIGNPPSFLALIIGGRALDDNYALFAPFWFITCLFVTQIMFYYLLRFRTSTQTFLILLFYILAHIESYLLPDINSYLLAHIHSTFLVPWNADVALIAIGYYAIGFYAQQRPNFLKLNRIIVSLVFFIIILIFYFLKIIDYQLDMKYLVYNNALLDLLIPLSMTLILFKISEILKNFTLLNIMGDNSMTIMYLHLPLMVLAAPYIHNVILQIIFAIVLSLITTMMLKKSNSLSILFLGSSKRRIN